MVHDYEYMVLKHKLAIPPSYPKPSTCTCGSKHFTLRHHYHQYLHRTLLNLSELPLEYTTPAYLVPRGESNTILSQPSKSPICTPGLREAIKFKILC